MVTKPTCSEPPWRAVPIAPHHHAGGGVLALVWWCKVFSFGVCGVCLYQIMIVLFVWFDGHYYNCLVVGLVKGV